MVFHGVTKELRQRMKIVAQGHVPNLMFLHSFSFVRLNAPCVDCAHKLNPEELPCARKAGRDSEVAVWVRSIFHLSPLQKLGGGILELADQNPVYPGVAFLQRFPALRLLVLSRPRVLFCGGQAGCSVVCSTVQLEAVMPREDTQRSAPPEGWEH